MVVSYSGSIGKKRLTVQQAIDHAFMACKLAREQIAGEYIETAKEQLNFMLSAWATEGTPLWCQTKYILPLVQGQYQLNVAEFVPGVIDVLEANLRQCTQFTGTVTNTSGLAGSYTLQLATAAAVENVGIMAAADAIYDISLLYSNDGVSWTDFYDNTALDVSAGEYVWLDFQSLPTATYWRLQANAGTVLNLTQMFFGNNAMEIPVARINVDDYWNLPNKTFQGRPVQYWCDRQVDGPVMWLWPAPGAGFVNQAITVLAHRHIMDVETMTENIEVPQRVQDAVVLGLGARLRMVIAEVDKQATSDLPAAAAMAKKLMWGEERDTSPINLQIDLTAYTR
jgi:hypothetical protein